MCPQPLAFVPLQQTADVLGTQGVHSCMPLIGVADEFFAGCLAAMRRPCTQHASCCSCSSEHGGVAAVPCTVTLVAAAALHLRSSVHSG